MQKTKKNQVAAKPAKQVKQVNGAVKSGKQVKQAKQAPGAGKSCNKSGKQVKQVKQAKPVAQKKRIRKPLTDEQRKRKQERDRAYRARKAAAKRGNKRVTTNKPVTVKKPVAAIKPVKAVKDAKPAVQRKRVRKPLTAEQKARKNLNARKRYAAKHGKKVIGVVKAGCSKNGRCSNGRVSCAGCGGSGKYSIAKTDANKTVTVKQCSVPVSPIADAFRELGQFVLNNVISVGKINQVAPGVHRQVIDFPGGKVGITIANLEAVPQERLSVSEQMASISRDIARLVDSRRLS